MKRSYVRSAVAGAFTLLAGHAMAQSGDFLKDANAQTQYIAKAQDASPMKAAFPNYNVTPAQISKFVNGFFGMEGTGLKGPETEAAWKAAAKATVDFSFFQTDTLKKLMCRVDAVAPEQKFVYLLPETGGTLPRGVGNVQAVPYTGQLGGVLSLAGVLPPKVQYTKNPAACLSGL